jgi:aryl-alcohol dehydrogenase-like predicted oxidoreductase
MIEQRPLGASGHRISAIGLGSVNIAAPGWSGADEEAGYRLMDHALERGITFFDTAEAYSVGKSERTIGNWLCRTGNRDKITLCSKVLDRVDNIHAALEATLDRLSTDYVDVYLLHEFVDSPPLDEILAAMTEEVRAGRVRTIGCSNFTAAQLEGALAISRSRGYEKFGCIQSEYSLVTMEDAWAHFPVGLPEMEDELLPLCEREQIAVTTYSPLGGGLLTGKYTHVKPLPPDEDYGEVAPVTYRFSERNLKIVESLRSLAETRGVPMARLAMAWAMTHPSVTSVVIGPRNAEQIDEAVAAREMGLDPELRAEMSAWTRAS